MKINKTEQGKYQLLNDNNEIITKKDYDFIYDNISKKYIKFKNNNLVGLLDNEGKEVVKPLYKKIYQFYINGDLFLVTKYFNKIEIFNNNFKKIGYTLNYKEDFKQNSNTIKEGIKDYIKIYTKREKEAKVNILIYETKEGKYQLLNERGDIISKKDYDKINKYLLNDEKYIPFVYNNYIGLLDFNGNEVIKPIYTWITQLIINNKFYIITEYFETYQIWNENFNKLGKEITSDEIYNIDENFKKSITYFVNKFESK